MDDAVVMFKSMKERFFGSEEKKKAFMLFLFAFISIFMVAVGYALIALSWFGKYPLYL